MESFPAKWVCLQGSDLRSSQLMVVMARNPHPRPTGRGLERWPIDYWSWSGKSPSLCGNARPTGPGEIEELTVWFTRSRAAFFVRKPQLGGWPKTELTAAKVVTLLS